MAIFEYVATDPTGNSVDGTFEAQDERDARNILSQYNLTVQSLNEQGKAKAAAVPKIDSPVDEPSKAKSKGKDKKAAKKKKKGGLLRSKLGEGPPMRISPFLPARCPP